MGVGQRFFVILRSILRNQATLQPILTFRDQFFINGKRVEYESMMMIAPGRSVVLALIGGHYNHMVTRRYERSADLKTRVQSR